MTVYYRPIVQTDLARPNGAAAVAGGWCWFDRAERIERGGARQVVSVKDIPGDVLIAITAPRADVAGLRMDQPRLMGILNVTPDSFSDGGLFHAPDDAVGRALQMVGDGADILDVGGESTRPGAEVVAAEEEILRVVPVISTVRAGTAVPISVDTRKSDVAAASLAAGANMINDVSAFNFDPKLSETVKKNDVPVCLMHTQGDPKTMQVEPTYDDVLLDIYDYLDARISAAIAAGITRNNIVIDPGIGFGKTLDHNLALLRGLSLFHGLGCPVLLGASRKRFIGNLGSAPNAADRGPGSIAVTLAGVAQGVQIHRVHDIKESRQALTLWALQRGQGSSYDKEVIWN